MVARDWGGGAVSGKGNNCPGFGLGVIKMFAVMVPQLCKHTKKH